jgi:hypothetical protein
MTRGTLGIDRPARVEYNHAVRFTLSVRGCSSTARINPNFVQISTKTAGQISADTLDHASVRYIVFGPVGVGQFPVYVHWL